MSTSTEIRRGEPSRSIETGPRERGGGILYLGLTAVMWGLNWPVNKTVLAHLPPFTSRSCTGAIGVALFFTLARLRGERLGVPAAQWRPLLASTAFNFTFWITGTALSLLWLSASEAVIIAYTMPIWVVLLAYPILGEKPRPAGVLGLAFGLAGVAILVLAQPVQASWEKLPGALFALGAAVSFALGTVLGKRLPVRLPPLTSVMWQILLGTSPLTLAALFVDHPDFAALTPGLWVCVAYAGLVGLGLGYFTWFAALRRLPAGTASTGALLVPVCGVLFSAVAFGEPLGLRQIAALGLTLAGVALAAR